MKKCFLLLAAGLIAGIANGQQAVKSVVFNNDAPSKSATINKSHTSNNLTPGNITSTHAVAHKTTSGGSRWFDYVNDILATNPSVSGTASTGIDLWNDTTSIWGYESTPVYSGNDYTSYAMNFDPYAEQWADTTIFITGIIAIRPVDAYTIDSVSVPGWYNRNLLKPGIVDTLIFAFVQGSGSSSATDDMAGDGLAAPGPSLYGVTTLGFPDIYHDSVNNRAGHNGGTTTAPPLSASDVYKFLLYPTDTNNSNSLSGTQFPRYSRPAGMPADPTISYAVSPAHYSGMSVTFKSGDHAYPAFPARDTVRYSSGTAITGYKYGSFTGEVIFAVTSAGGTTADFPPYLGSLGDFTTGYFKQEGSRDNWAGTYVPNWAFTDATTGGAFVLQFPPISFHVTCSTCLTTGTGTLGVQNVINEHSVKAYPNPATDQLNIAFSLSQTVPVSVTLTDMLGQVVATENSNNVSNGKAVFNTANLASGLYIYTVEANGERLTGHVSIAH